MLIKNVFIVSCTNYNFNKIQKNKKKSEIINPYLIREKLTDKNKVPSDEIVSYHIIKKINAFKTCKFSQFIYYYQLELNKSFIEEIKKIFDSGFYDVAYHLLIDSSIKKDSLESVIEYFESVQYIENL
jgi:hypothetical protein